MIDNPQERLLLLEKLSKKPWFKTIDKKNFEKLKLSANNLVLDQLSRIDEELDNKEIIGVLEIIETDSLWVFLIKFRYLINNQTETREIVVPKETDNEMGKSLIVVKTSSGKKFIVLNRDMKAINIKYPSFSTGKTVFLPAKLEKWLKDKAKTQNLAIKGFVDLGIYRPYSELSTIQKPLFAIMVDSVSFEVNDDTDFVSIDSDNIASVLDNDGDTAVTIIAARLKSKNLL